MACPECGNKEIKRTRIKYRGYNNLKNVIIDGAVRVHCPECGEENIYFERIEELDEIIAKTIALKKTPLIPPEIRFLRTYLGFSSKDFAEEFGVTKETVSRWESELSPKQMARSTELFVRYRVLTQKPLQKYKDIEEPIKVGKLASLKEKKKETINISSSEKGWSSNGIEIAV